MCLPFAAASTGPPDSTCAASMTLRSLKSDRSTYKAAHKQAANQAASQSIFRMQREARFWSRNDGNNHRGVVIDHRGSHPDSRKLSRSSLRCLCLSSTPPPPPTRAQKVVPAPRFVESSEPHDVWDHRNPLLLACRYVLLSLCRGRAAIASRAFAAKLIKYGLREVSFPLRNSGVFGTYPRPRSRRLWIQASLL